MAKKDYSSLTKDQLLEVIEKLEGKKKYGLIWDEERVPEKVVTDCQDKLPVLTEVKGKEIITNEDEPTHILIEGDNYHALSVLNYTHKGKIDLIYIDPPYNTGNKDFIYNDKYVEKEDNWRHSKWLNFMSKRLELAKELLTEKGVIFISIDDNEQAQLKMLCNEIFGEINYIAQFIWNKKNVRQNDAKFVSNNHEYIICFAKNITNVKFNLLPRSEELNSSYSNPDNDPRGNWTSVKMDAKSGGVNSYYEVTFDNGVVWKPSDGRYPAHKKENLINFYNDNRLWFGKTGKNVPRLKKFLTEVKQGVITNTLLLADEVGSTQLAKETLKNIVSNNLFETPKPVELIKTFIRLNTKENSIILDFFAGSGTTAQALLELNKEEQTNRKFIICTNNENGICDNVTFPRVRNLMKGYTNAKTKSIESLGNNLKYFKTSFVANNLNKDQLKINITMRCTEMLCLKEGIFNLMKEEADYKIFQQGNRYLAVYYDFANASLDELKEEMNALKGEKVLYCFTIDNHGLDKANFSGWKNIRLEPIPQKILDVYKRIFKN